MAEEMMWHQAWVLWMNSCVISVFEVTLGSRACITQDSCLLDKENPATSAWAEPQYGRICQKSNEPTMAMTWG